MSTGRRSQRTCFFITGRGRGHPCGRGARPSGEAIIFDDSLEHWVGAFDAEPTAQRIVLVVDVPHPDLRDNK